MTKTNNTTKAYLVWAIIGLVVAVVGIVVTAVVFPNWESHADIEVVFTKNSSEKITSYYDVNTDSLRAAQKEGTSACVYTIYTQTRTQTRYTSVVSGLSFSENDTWNGETYSLSSAWWNDIRFKVLKTGGTSTKSVLNLSIGEED